MKILYFISLLFSLCIYGQSHTIQWYMDNRLPQISIRDTLKDKYNFIWLFMKGRVLRYGGSNFVEYKNFKLKNVSFGDYSGVFKKKENDGPVIFKNYALDFHMVIQLLIKINSEMTFHQNTLKGISLKSLLKYDKKNTHCR
ncbi:hypothetical protein SAMN06265171_103410 [Chryseobacterium rhizoplanae]|uniref:Uncharacterized protein n=1 Tax=Chryseobacterium rhizoplanae TaxID=1609531 RepID=A0A521CV78_9FLAO|nr:hypothetical protein SAMN06265171_103410 [Chryseobacterium rhizoplanae]